MLIDAHAHLDRYEDTLELVLAEINKHSIFTISTSMDRPSFERNLKIAERCDLVLPAFGIHPWNAPEYVDKLEELRDALDKSPIIGEIGLDHHFIEDTSQYAAQYKVFEFFLLAAKEQNKIVNLHTKGAEREILNRLIQYDIQHAIIHWYSGPFEAFNDLLDKGAYFTIGVELLYSDHIKALARQIPFERLLTETDNPGGYRWLTGEIGMPSMITNVINSLAEVKHTTAEYIIEIVQDNFIRLIETDEHLRNTCKNIFT
jgi:TatD DNase family protein